NAARFWRHEVPRLLARNKLFASGPATPDDLRGFLDSLAPPGVSPPASARLYELPAGANPNRLRAQVPCPPASPSFPLPGTEAGLELPLTAGLFLILSGMVRLTGALPGDDVIVGQPGAGDFFGPHPAGAGAYPVTATVAADASLIHLDGPALAQLTGRF